MKKCVFWIFQLLVMVGVAVTAFLLLHEPRFQTALNTNDGNVLAESSVVFPHTDPALPNPNTVFALVNQSRQAAGLDSLVADESLARIAQKRAADMRSTGYYAHQNPTTKRTFVDDLKSSQISYGFACENLDLEFLPSEQKFVQAWLGSTTGHRECMMDKGTTRAGYAVTQIDMGNDHVANNRAYIVVAVHITELD